MRKKLLKHLTYYISVPVVFYLFLLLVSLFLDIGKIGNDLGTVIFVTYAFLFVGTPILTVVLMRFSMLPCIVDPFAALEIPLVLYIAMIINVYGRTGSLSKAIIRNHHLLIDDGGEGYIFLFTLFIFGLVASISFKRTNGDFLVDRLIRKFKEIKNNEQ